MSFIWFKDFLTLRIDQKYLHFSIVNNWSIPCSRSFYFCNKSKINIRKQITLPSERVLFTILFVIILTQPLLLSIFCEIRARQLRR